jgi:SAM-dependent methyltransferase
MSELCYLCGSASVQRFRTLDLQCSVTTDGQVIPLPLLKAQCTACGLVQAAQNVDRIFAHLSYRDNYAFYARPNMKAFDTPLYRRYAQWVADLMAGQDDDCRVLEVGCGAGWVLQNLRSIRPAARLQGVEPSASASQAAKQAGIDVAQGAAGDPVLDALHGRFDFVYSIDVIEHTADPVAFVRDMAKFVAPNGTVCVICPLGDVVNMELLFIDHLYSIRAANLRHIFEAAGLQVSQWSRGPENLTPWQCMSGGLSAASVSVSTYDCPASLLDLRTRHIEQWRTLDDRLRQRLEGRSEVLCFGAGETSDLLQTLVPRSWRQIAGHLVDAVPSADRKTAYRDKPLYYMDDPDVGRFDTTLLGVKPHYQQSLHQRLAPQFAHVIRWDDIVEDRVEAWQ